MSFLYTFLFLRKQNINTYSKESYKRAEPKKFTTVLFLLCTTMTRFVIKSFVFLSIGLNFLKGDTVPTKKSYSGSQLWQIETVNHDVINKIENVDGVQLWREHKLEEKMFLDILVPQETIQEMKNYFNEQNLTFSTSILDIQKAIDNENPPLHEIEELHNRDGRPINWHTYYRLNDIHKFLDYMQINNPDLVSTRIIGKSSQRRPLKVLVISNKDPANKVIWVDAGIHAREWISPATCTYIINKLVEEWDSLPSMMRQIDWHFLPVTNADGYEYSHDYDRLWRKSRSETSLPYCKGVDLNRNYGYKWGGKGVSKSPCSEIYGGSGPFSEPETEAIRNYIQSLEKPISASLSFHSYGQYILFPWGYDAFITEDNAELLRVANEAAEVSS